MSTNTWHHKDGTKSVYPKPASPWSVYNLRQELDRIIRQVLANKAKGRKS